MTVEEENNERQRKLQKIKVMVKEVVPVSFGQNPGFYGCVANFSTMLRCSIIELLIGPFPHLFSLAG